MKRVVMILCAVLAGSAREPRKFNRTEVMIPMRDGARLHTLIYAPQDVKKWSAGKLPFLIERSPYGWTGKKPDNALVNRYKELAEEGWIRDDTLERMRGQYRFRSNRFRARYSGVDDDGVEERSVQYQRLRRELLDAERQAVLTLRNRGTITEAVAQRVQRDIDLEDSRLDA